MYTYYLMALVLGPVRIKRFVWLKRQVTKLQIVQFVAVIAHEMLLFVWNDCGYPIYMAVILSSMCLLLLVLFLQF